MAVIRATVTKGDTDAVLLDSVSHSVLTIDHAHHEIHEGGHFAYIAALDMTNAQTKSFILTTPDSTSWSHFLMQLNSEAEVNVDIYEGATPEDDGAVVSDPAVINRNRNSSSVNGMSVKEDPTLGAGSKGTQIAQLHAGSGLFSGGTVRGDSELVLKQNTKYWIDVTNATANNNFVGWVMDWYEHIAKD